MRMLTTRRCCCCASRCVETRPRVYHVIRSFWGFGDVLAKVLAVPHIRWLGGYSMAERVRRICIYLIASWIWIVMKNQQHPPSNETYIHCVQIRLFSREKSK
jgi:hypothetical protein